MSFDVALARMAQLQSLLPAPPRPPRPWPPPPASHDELRHPVAERRRRHARPAAPAGSAGQAIVNLVPSEVGVAEQPPGSNDSPRIAQFRQATAGSGVGPWCAYFTSWAAREAGVPLGDNGQGFGRVDDVYAWAQKAGKAIPNGAATSSRSPAT